MNPKELIGKQIGARAYKVLSLYDSPLPPFKLKQKITTRGGILSTVTDVVARPSTAGNELMIGLQDENGTTWVLYQPDLFYINAKSDTDSRAQWVTISETDIAQAAEANSFLNTMLKPVKGLLLAVVAVAVILPLIKRK
jgi:hypothetical protein